MVETSDDGDEEEKLKEKEKTVDFGSGMQQTASGRACIGDGRCGLSQPNGGALRGERTHLLNTIHLDGAATVTWMWED